MKDSDIYDCDTVTYVTLIFSSFPFTQNYHLVLWTVLQKHPQTMALVYIECQGGERTFRTPFSFPFPPPRTLAPTPTRLSSLLDR